MTTIDASTVVDAALAGAFFAGLLGVLVGSGFNHFFDWLGRRLSRKPPTSAQLVFLARAMRRRARTLELRAQKRTLSPGGATND